MNNTPFAEFKAILEKMTPEYKERLLGAHKRFASLRGLCSARGYIENINKMGGIRVLKQTPEVIELKEVIDILKPGGFIWEDIDTTEKKSKKQSDAS
jgi:hypothetical protein